MRDIAPLGCQSNDEITYPPSAIGTKTVLYFILIITTMTMDLSNRKWDYKVNNSRNISKYRITENKQYIANSPCHQI
jgi:hypothetical protein